MAKYVVVAIYDVQVEAFHRPMFVQANGQAVRMFQDECNRQAPDNTMHAHPEDFRLFQLGEFEDATGKFVLFDQPKVLANGSDVAALHNQMLVHRDIPRKG